MSYLELTGGISDCDKAVISLWFRVPDATLQAVMDQPDDIGNEQDAFGYYIPPLYRIIPLVTFGSVETAFRHHNYEGADTYPLYPISPSFIGVDCNNPVPTVAVNLQMSNSTTFSQEPQFIDNVMRPDAFYMSGWGSTPYTGIEPQTLEVTPDHWHHILISFDLSLSCSCYTPDFEEVPFLPPRQITPGPTFTWAFDDEDKVGPSMGQSGGAIYISPPGATHPMVPIPPDSIIPSALYDYVQAIAPPGGITATWNPVKLKMEHSIGLPTAAQFVESVYPVELAELQFFAGVTLDTRIESNRRAFVSKSTLIDPPPTDPTADRYTGGTPVDPNKKSSDDDPQSGSIELLGKEPDILLHGSGNWIIGKNTGQMIGNPDFNPGLPVSASNPEFIPDPAKQFTPTGKIVSYTPDPSLHGPQSPPPPESGERRRQRRMMASLAA